jgi:hypothetical protein
MKRAYIFFLIISLIFSGFSTYASTLDTDSSRKESKIGFFDLNVGPDVRYFRGGYQTDSSNRFTNHAYLITARMQHSFLGNYILDKAFKKFRFGDILAGELSPGFIVDKPGHSTTPWIAYRFELGFGAIWSINTKNEIGLTLTLLKFARDRVAPNISGSNIMLRYRYGRIVVEGGIEARRDRIFGWLLFFNKGNELPVQYTFTSRYLIDKKRNLGVRCEFMSGEFGRNYINDQFILKNLWSLKLFYGIYF